MPKGPFLMETRPNTPPAPTGGSDRPPHPVPAGTYRAGRSIRDRLVGGLLLALPLLITLWVLGWLYSILEKKVIDPLAGLLLWKLKWTTSSTDLPYWFETYAAPVLAIVLALALLYLLDLLADTKLHR